jgi:hypothetical protein
MLTRPTSRRFRTAMCSGVIAPATSRPCGRCSVGTRAPRCARASRQQAGGQRNGVPPPTKSCERRPVPPTELGRERADIARHGVCAGADADRKVAERAVVPAVRDVRVETQLRCPERRPLDHGRGHECGSGRRIDVRHRVRGTRNAGERPGDSIERGQRHGGLISRTATVSQRLASGQGGMTRFERRLPADRTPA